MSNLEIRKRFELAGFQESQVQLYKDNFAKGASDEELFFFMTVCKQTGLDPVKRQIFLVPRYDKNTKKNIFTPQPSVDGLRLIAEKSGTYEGQSGPFWCGKDGVWKDVWLAKEHPEASKVGVYKKGCREPIWGIARWDAYVQTYYKDGQTHIGPMWSKMGDTMLAKCAESAALRKACPDATHGLYTKEEMEQATDGQEVEAKDLNERIAPAIDLRPVRTSERTETPKVSPQINPNGSSEETVQRQEPEMGTHESDLNSRFVGSSLAVTTMPKEKTKPVMIAVEPPSLPDEDLPELTHWDRLASAGVHSGKTLRAIYETVGKDEFLKMYQTSTKSIGKMNDEGKPIPRNTMMTYKDIESCVKDLGL